MERSQAHYGFAVVGCGGAAMTGYRRLPAKAPERKDADTSIYRNPCPSCGAPPWHYCRSGSGNRNTNAHIERESRNTEPLPDLRDWWRSMKVYEGKHPLLRPADLVVP
jgi:hypothetical protein